MSRPLTVRVPIYCVLALNYLCPSGRWPPAPFATFLRPIKDYCEEFRDIISKSKKNGPTENGITLVNQNKFTDELPVMCLVFYCPPICLFIFCHFPMAASLFCCCLLSTTLQPIYCCFTITFPLPSVPCPLCFPFPLLAFLYGWYARDR